jgi:hypothetical protein
MPEKPVTDKYAGIKWCPHNMNEKFCVVCSDPERKAADTKRRSDEVAAERKKKQEKKE